MGLIRECDIYPGRTKDVKKFRIRITQVDEQGKELADVRNCQRYMCPAALMRTDSFFDRATTAPTKAKADES